MLQNKIKYPLAITMWDFSWLERRWPGAGYEDWDQALDELKVRGYDAVRLDAYPHLVAADAGREWELLPCWNQQDWGSPALNRVVVQPHLNQFIEKCAEHGMLVGLSTWFRQDRDDLRRRIKSPEELGGVWQATLDSIAAAGLLDHILYVDLCNEFPLSVWAPFFNPYDAFEHPDKQTPRHSPDGVRWMRDSIAVCRAAYPQLDYCFSFTTEYDTWREQDVSFHDLLEPHIWMIMEGGFYQQVGYSFERFDSKGYENVALHAEQLYRDKPDHWKACLQTVIDTIAEWGAVSGKPLITTECWSLVDYKDWPLLKWDWLQDLCDYGVRAASKTGRWAALGTSNFCGPQFVGMWRDVRWHQRLTEVIHNGPFNVR
jgi:hypothetical protein